MTKKTYTAGAARRRQKKQVNRAVWLIVACGVIFVAGMLMPSRCVGDDGRPSVSSATIGASDLESVVTNPALASEMVRYTGMTISFNPELHLPNWVAYELTADEVQGDEPRTNRFYTDHDVPGCASPDDYRNTGYDRGHMAPAADMKWNPQAMAESFSMANIAPQANVLNRGSWSKLEDKCRQRALKDSAVIIISGPVLTDPVEIRIGDNRVAVPSRFFKVILSPYTTPPTAIGFLMPNEAVKGGMQQCAVSVDSVEAVTGHDFFSALPDEIENYVESQVNFNKWSRTR
ncbi:MAG: DNA/RNA non-specific endonuclease [Muribaculaceae bacterium]|nr:DNA/RNA non-specific endonuclease [Muribaculaceae bacterium]